MYVLLDSIDKNKKWEDFIMVEEENYEKYIEIEQLSYSDVTGTGLRVQFNRLFNPDGFDKYKIVIHTGFTPKEEVILNGEKALEFLCGGKEIVLNAIKEKTDILAQNAINTAIERAKKEKENKGVI
jgi:hypothetical protein